MELDKTAPLEKGKNHICSFKVFSAENILDYYIYISRDYYINKAFMNKKILKLH